MNAIFAPPSPQVVEEDIRTVWASRWWLDPQYVSFYSDRFSPAQVDAAILRVSEVFDPKWAATVGMHPYLMQLLPTGVLILQFLYSLGEDLLTVDGSLRLASVLRDLRHPGNCDSARLELELAAHLKRKGHTIEFRPQLPNGKESDFVARCEGQDVYFELKRMQASQKQLAADNLVYSVAMAMRRLTESSQSPQIKHRGYRIELADFSDGLGRGRESDESLISGIVQSIVRETRRRAEVGLPLDFVIPNVATVRIGDTGKESSGVTGFSASADHEMKRILRGHFLDALQQIHSKHPGIVVVQTPALLHRHNVEATLLDLLNGAELDAANLSSAIFLPVYHSIPEPWSIFHSFPVVNPKAKFPAMALKAFHDLREIYEAECRTVRDPK